ncbi:MAG TPA: LysR family transcriptional regulator [Steroidobacteraceae bacterium]|nr:LysR family transcriptional regulator [Steroidobacteraceae bacterium]
MRTPIVRFRIEFAKDCHVGPGKIGLLEAIRECGSLSQAARNMGMSYRRAWLLVDSLRGAFREPVTLASTGGKGGGGAQVTKFGEALIDGYRELERDFAALAARRLQAILPAVTSGAVANTKLRPHLAAPRRKKAPTT